MIITENHGPLIRSSNYWQSEMAVSGYYYLTPNAGTFRLLCPQNRKDEIRELRTGKTVVLTVGIVHAIAQPGMQIGREMTELLFDDRSESPFALYLSMEQWERLPAADDYNKLWEFTAWESRRGLPHKVMSRPAFLRRGDLPCLQAWEPAG